MTGMTGMTTRLSFAGMTGMTTRLSFAGMTGMTTRLSFAGMTTRISYFFKMIPHVFMIGLACK